MYYVYVIRKADGKIYIGYTNDLKRRVSEHKSKTRALGKPSARPSTNFGALEPELIYYEAYKDKIDAQDREKKLKQRGRSIKWLKERIKNSLKK
mgnify:CR=1 FL=1